MGERSTLQDRPPEVTHPRPADRSAHEPVPFLIAPERRVWPRRLVLAAGALVLLVLLGVLGWVAGRALEPAPARVRPVPPRTVRSGSFALELPGTWRARSAPAGSVAAAVGAGALSALPSSPSFVWVGGARIDDPSLVPQRVRALLAGPLPSPHDARLAGRPAWSYAGLRRADGGRLDLTVAPTRHGVLLVACEQPSSGLVTAACGPGVLAVDGPAPLKPSPALALQMHAGPILRALRADRRTGTKALRRARNHRRQAVAAHRLAAVHATAAAALAPYAAPSRPGRRVVASLRRLRAGYLVLAGAARNDKPRRYRTARRRIRRSDAALVVAVDTLAGEPVPASVRRQARAASNHHRSSARHGDRGRAAKGRPRGGRHGSSHHKRG